MTNEQLKKEVSTIALRYAFFLRDYNVKIDGEQVIFEALATAMSLHLITQKLNFAFHCLNCKMTTRKNKCDIFGLAKIKITFQTKEKNENY